MMKPAPLPLLALLLLCSCASLPAFIEPPVAVPDKWQAEAGQASTALPLWWTSFNDPALTALVDKSLTNNLDLKLAQARLREAEAVRALAKAQYWPSLTANAEGGSSGSNNSSHDSYQLGSTLSWEADLWGEKRLGDKAASADYQASEAERYGTQISLVAEVASSYVDLALARQRLTIAKSNLASQQETYQFITWRNQAGLIGQLTLDQASTTIAQTKAQIPSLEITEASARHRLAVLTGAAPEEASFATLEAKLPTLPATPDIGLPADVLRRRPDVMAAERNLAASVARTGVAETALYPSFTLSGTLGLAALSPADILSGGTISRSLLGSIAGTLFDAGRLRQNLHISEAQQEQAFITYQQTILTALEEVENALVSLKRNTLRRELLDQAALSAASAASLAASEYQAGTIDYQTLQETERTRLSAEDTAASARAAELSSLITLYKAAGGGWTVGENHAQN